MFPNWNDAEAVLQIFTMGERGLSQCLATDLSHLPNRNTPVCETFIHRRR